MDEKEQEVKVVEPITQHLRPQKLTREQRKQGVVFIDEGPKTPQKTVNEQLDNE
jgi:hypothetical protein